MNRELAQRIRLPKEQDPYRNVSIRYKEHPLQHLRDVWMRDEDDCADWAQKMAPDISPYYSSFYQGMEKWHKMNVMDQKTFEGVVASFPAQEMAFVGVMPESMLTMLYAQDADFLKDKARVYRFLAKHPEYKVPGSRNTPIGG